MKSPRDSHQTTQRVKVGMIGLAAVILLIGLASAIIGSVTRERPVAAVGASRSGIVANMAIGNAAMVDGTREPLAELGVAPGATNQQGPAGSR